LLLCPGDLGIHRRWHDHSAHRCARLKSAIEFHAEPASELGGISERAPHAFPWRMQQDFLLYAVCVHKATSWLQINKVEK